MEHYIWIAIHGKSKEDSAQCPVEHVLWCTQFLFRVWNLCSMSFSMFVVQKVTKCNFVMKYNFRSFEVST
jgi:hypothetical protein